MDLRRIPENASLENSSGHSNRLLCSTVQRTRDAFCASVCSVGGSLYTDPASKAFGYAGEFPLVIRSWRISDVFKWSLRKSGGRQWI